MKGNWLIMCLKKKRISVPSFRKVLLIQVIYFDGHLHEFLIYSHMKSLFGAQ